MEDIMREIIEPVADKLKGKGREKLADMFDKCFRNTWETTLKRFDDGEVFLITGDIPAMWLRDSSAQVWHYLPYAAKYPIIGETICGLIKRQLACVALDPYANAFNSEPNAKRFSEDRTNQSPEIMNWIWERKYEIDSLCYPIRLAYAYWQATGDTSWCGEAFRKVAENIVKVWTSEQNHFSDSQYFFERDDCPPSDTLPNHGRGTDVGYTGMTWSGFRPSDDACQFGYLIPSNMFAAHELGHLHEIVHALTPDAELERTILKLGADISDGIAKYGKVRHEVFGDMYAYETDGRGNYNLMDDANVPSLLSMSYLGCLSADDPLYQNTRRFILSDYNPYYYSGKALRGVGSPHTPKNYVWPISLCIQGLTATDPAEIARIANMLQNTDADTGFMHEGIYVNDPQKFTRPWFAWANSIFSEFIEKYAAML